MSASILVGYATRHGSTQEVAESIAARPAAVFALGPFHEDAKEFQDARGQLDPAALRFPYNVIPALKQMPASDIRDWTAIRAWANGLAVKLQSSR